MRRMIPLVLATFLVGYGLISIFLNLSLLLDLYDVKGRSEAFIPFVAWGNLLVGILYLAAAYGLAQLKKWVTLVLIAAALLLTASLLGLFLHILAGAAYETHTLISISIRLGLTLLFTWASHYYFKVPTP